MNIYFIILIVLKILDLGIELGRHGQQKEQKYNFWTSLVGAIIGTFLLVMAIRSGF